MFLKHRYMDDTPGDAGGAAVDQGTPPATVDQGGAPPATVDQGTPPANFFQNLPETWRQDLVTAAGYEGDEAPKRIAQLERVSDLPVFAKNYFNAQDRIRKGEMSTGLPDNPTADQLAEWRSTHGVPLDVVGYKADLGDGLVLSEGDDRILGDVYPIAHKHNIPSSAMNEIVNAVLTARQREAQGLEDKDGIDKQSAEKAVRDAWGSDTVGNTNAIAGLVNTLPEKTKEVFLNARMSDGRAVFNDPGFLVAMADWARRLNPAGTVVPDSVNPVQTIADELKQLKSQMGTKEWFDDPSKAERYQALLVAKEQMEAQG
jgi:hypothetical protein